MSDPGNITPEIRKIFFTGALQAVERQMQHLRAEHENITQRLEEAKEEIAFNRKQPDKA